MRRPEIPANDPRTPLVDPRRALPVSVLLVGVDNTIVNVALPTLSRDLSASTSQLQWIVDAYTLVFAGLLLLRRHLGDRFGRRRSAAGRPDLVRADLARWRRSPATPSQLIAGRAAMGIGAALVYPGDARPADRRLHRTGASGPPRSASGRRTSAWRSPWARSPAGCCWSTSLGLGVPGQHADRGGGPGRRAAAAAGEPGPDPGRFDPVGAARLDRRHRRCWCGPSSRHPRHGWASTTTIVRVRGLGRAAWPASSSGSCAGPTRCSTCGCSATRGSPRRAASIALAFFGLFGFIFLITQYFQVVRGYSTLPAGAATLPFALVTGCGDGPARPSC